MNTNAASGKDDKKKKKDDYGEDMDIESHDDEQEEEGERKQTSKITLTETMDTGTKYGLTLTAISLAIHQHRSVVLWSLIDSMPVDAWKLVSHPTDGVLVWGVNTIVYVTMGGKIKCALATNGFAKIGCPAGLIPPPSSQFSGGGSSKSGELGYLECNPSPLPKLAIQLDGARVSFVTNNVAMVCLGNGTLYSLELHDGNMMSLMSLGHKVGGLGVASCLSVLSAGCHDKSVGKYLAHDVEGDEKEEKKPETVASTVSSSSALASSSGGPKVKAKGLVFVGSRMGDCTLLAFSMNEPIPLVVTDVDADDDGTNIGDKRKSDDKKVKPDAQSSLSIGEPKQKHPRINEETSSDVVEILDDDNAENGEGQVAPSSLTHEEILRLEEEELYRDDETTDEAVAPSIVSSSNVDSEEDSYAEDGEQSNTTPRRRTVRCLSMFRSIRALDSLTGLGPLGGGCYGPVATCPSLTGQDDAMGTKSSVLEVQASMFSNEFSSAARHYIMPCGFGASGGLAVLTTPGRDNVGGSILCESDLCNMAGPIFGLPKSNLVLLGKADGVGSIALRGVIRQDVSEE